MSLGAPTVAAAWRLFKSHSLSEAEAKSHASTLWSREELTAALLLDPDVFGAYPGIRKALLDVAKANYAAAQTPREARGDAKSRRRADLNRAAALGALVKSEADRQATFLAAQMAIRDFARLENGSTATVGIEWWIAHEGNAT